MAEAILRAHLQSREINAEVSSAGTDAWAGAATDYAVVAMSEFGIDLSNHRSSQITPEMISKNDLILVMTRNHADRVALLDSEATNRTFLPGELIRLGAAAPLRASTESVRAWSEIVAINRPRGPIGRGADEITDPVGETLAAYKETARRLNVELAAIAKLLAPDSDRREVAG